MGTLTIRVWTSLQRTARWAVEPRTPTASRGDWAIALTLTLIGSVVCLWRIPGESRNLLWAEDGSIFVTAALGDAPFASIFEPYAGYLHIFPRLVTAAVASLSPLASLPFVLTIAACATTAAVAGAAYLLLAPRVSSRLARIAVSLAIVGSSVAGVEVNGSIANSHWYLMVGLFAALLTAQSSAGMIALASALVVLATLSDPLAAVFSPLAFAQLLAARTRRDLWVPCLYFIALAVQVFAVLGAEREPVDTPAFDPLARAFLFRVVLAAETGPYVASSIVGILGVPALVAAGLALTLILIVFFVRQPAIRSLILVATLMAAAFFLVSAALRWFPQLDPTVDAGWGGSRYSVVPIILLVIALAGAASTASPAVVRPTLSVLLILIVAATAAFGWRTTARHSVEPWTEALASAAADCRGEDPDTAISIRVAPENFAVALSCQHLKGSEP